MSTSVKLGFFGALAAASALAQTTGEPVRFVLRVNPQWAARVNSVLARLAQPVEITLKEGEKAADRISQLCGGFAVAAPTERVDAATGERKLRVPPCVRMKTDAAVKVQPGNTLEEIAVRSGLLAQDAKQLKVAASAGERPRPVDPDKLPVGHVVRIPRMPLWTSIAAEPGPIHDRTAFIEELGKAIGCPLENREKCLVGKGVFVLEGSPKAAAPPRNEPFPLLLENLAPARIAAPPRAAAARRGVLGALAWSPALAAAAMTLPVRLPAPRMLAAVPVAADQWPYDVDLLRAVLADQKAFIRDQAIIGIADGGLAGPLGSPLPEEVFQPNADELAERGDSAALEDRDGNDVLNDVFGAGERRDSNQLMRTGDLALCSNPQPPFSNWNDQSLRVASHGAVVLSLAAGLKLRRPQPPADVLLPRAVFYRLLPQACSPEAAFDAPEGAMVPAFEYLESRNADVISLSYMDRGGYSKTFEDVMERKLQYGQRILVLAAGNGIPGNLDETHFCPPCLGNSREVRTVNQTIVVGAATRDLKAASYSNYGDSTVSLYAPGEPFGAVGLLGQDASAWPPSTSYAAPYVALAAGILRSFGYTKPIDIRDRLAAATWPLEGARAGIGVLDLVKVAAVKRHAVEVVEQDGNGNWERRTYVGTLLQRLDQLPICGGNPFLAGRVQALRLDGSLESDERRVVVYYRKDLDARTDRRQIRTVANTCRPTGELRLRTVAGVEKTFPLRSVTQIQVPWVPE